MSDEANENMDRAEEKTDDVEAHGFIGNVDNVETVDAQEEPPDVEGHSFGNVEKAD